MKIIVSFNFFKYTLKKASPPTQSNILNSAGLGFIALVGCLLIVFWFPDFWQTKDSIRKSNYSPFVS